MTPLSDITHLIQLAVAPVFLLTAVGTTLSVLTNRLARIVDRGRALEALYAAGTVAPSRVELSLLEKRARVIYLAITFAVISALFVSLLMTAAFAGYTLELAAPRLLVSLFMGAMLAYTFALLCLLGEVFFALRSFRLGIGAESQPRKTGESR